ncbi:hypothetical protein LTR85_001528 [Meristemomyces frigidus]|nr:hypothetical protein LTR85_001528 [Meristemomyces frigidus]
MDAAKDGQRFVLFIRSASTLAPRPPLSFLTLPSELRLLVYSFFDLVSDRPLTMRPSKADFFRDRMNLLRINRQIRDETLRTFYSNVFAARMSLTYDRGRFVRFIDMLGAENVGLLQHVRLYTARGQTVDFQMGTTGSTVNMSATDIIGGPGQQMVAVEHALVGLDVLAMEMAEVSEVNRLNGKAWIRVLDEVAHRLEAPASVASSPTTATTSASVMRADKDLGALLADISSHQNDIKHAQDQILRRLDKIELSQRGLLTSQRQTTEHLHRLQSAQHQLSDQATAVAVDVRLHRQDYARQYVRFPLNAGKRVTHVAELLEHILSELPVRDVLLAQRVSKQFQTVIKGSMRLQCKLFIHAEQPNWSQEGLQIRINPLLGGVLSHKYLIIDGETGCVSYKIPGSYTTDTCTMIEADKKSEKLVILLADTDPGMPTCTPEVERLTITRSIARGESWRWMLLTQPPIDIETAFNGEEIKSGDGVRRLGDLVDVFHPVEVPERH